jgi:hypothetical protein
MTAIPGGRYGCAQFVKICGPPELRDLSLGKISQLVQKAVVYDLLCYHKTLLLWTNKIKSIDEIDMTKDMINKSQNVEQSDEVKMQITKIEDAIIRVLNEYPNGISLA